MLLENIENGFIVFKNNMIKIIIDDNDIPWFYGKQVAHALGYKNTKLAIIMHVDKEDKIQFKNMKCNKYVKEKNTQPNGIYINESGLYSLILSSKLPNAKKFKNWVTRDVLPSIRKYGMYVQIKNNNKNVIMLEEKIKYLTNTVTKLKNQLKCEKYPTGGIVYVIDYSTDQEEAYKIGMTNDMKKRKKIYDTHSLYKRKIIYYKKHDCPLQLESCVKALLYRYRTQNKKETFACSKNIIIKSFKKCIQSIKCVNDAKCNQEGGNKQFLYDKILRDTVKEYELIKNKQLKLFSQIFNLIV